MKWIIQHHSDVVRCEKTYLVDQQLMSIKMKLINHPYVTHQ